MRGSDFSATTKVRAGSFQNCRHWLLWVSTMDFWMVR